MKNVSWINKVKSNFETSKPLSSSPLSISSILHFAWGMTLNLSHQDEQRYLAETFKGRFVALWDQYKTDNAAISFLNEVSFVLSASERSYGFERDIYFSRIDDWNTLRTDKIAYYKDLASITSGNSDSVYSRALAFLGTGSVGAFTDLLKNSQGAQVNAEFITIFLISGAIGFGIFTWLLRSYADRKIIDVDIEMSKYIDDFWQTSLRENLGKMYEHLAEDLKKVYAKYYKDEVLPSDETLKDEIDKMLPNQSAYHYIYPQKRDKKSRVS